MVLPLSARICAAHGSGAAHWRWQKNSRRRRLHPDRVTTTLASSAGFYQKRARGGGERSNCDPPGLTRYYMMKRLLPLRERNDSVSTENRGNYDCARHVVTRDKTVTPWPARSRSNCGAEKTGDSIMNVSRKSSPPPGQGARFHLPSHSDEVAYVLSGRGTFMIATRARSAPPAPVPFRAACRMPGRAPAGTGRVLFHLYTPPGQRGGLERGSSTGSTSRR